MDKYKYGTYHKVSFCGASNIDLNLITCEGNIVNPDIIQIYVLHWYHTYLLHPGIDRTEAKICQHLYWNGIINSALKEHTNCDTCQRTKK